MTIHPLSVFLSFRFLIELFTTIPFLISNFLEHGQFLYDKPVDALNTKLVYLVGMLIVLLYNGVSAFQYCEVTFANINYSILDSLYVVMVTLSTVGYGVMMLLIVISLAVLPGLLTDVMSTLRKRREGGGCVSKGAMPFILIVGVFRPDQVNDILEGFLNRENKEAYLNVVFLDINSPNEELKFYERNSIWGHRVQFLHGSALNIETLKRVRARYAKAIFTMADHYAADPAKEDERNTVRLWSLYCYTVGYNVPIYSYNLSPDTAVYQKMAKQIICVREFKQYLLAMNCCCRGSSTLLTNLLHQRQPMNRYDEPWQAQYGYYYLAQIVFRECQVILFAIKRQHKREGSEEIMLNPGNHYIIKDTDLCVYMAESPSEIKDINQLVRVESASRLPIHISSSTVSTAGHSGRFPYQLSYLPTSRHALMTGSSSIVGQLSDGTPVDRERLGCYLLDHPVTLDDVTLENADGMEDHILVCLHRRFTNIFKFIYNLRSPHLAPEELQEIVLLCTVPPTPKMFELLDRFPKGDCRRPDDLLRAGVKRARQVVVMSEKECLEQYEKSSDSPAM
ncbi:uncharacterized protein BYT42DRAFT_488398 [Radiomyces spectabilis]|uniref:uncharacterized protein n=1 Tax=Radiomyces spectabilis TaxID=64574 RepID=UPI00221F3EF8|nr:uncharacterized protein BYT42DRAFT_488398 [Radiomyces spectabilis]KAI8394175.1 hypothetical protein BYT42DRAFT_488398 [Radiomyces spectabilis]